jgi:hypothetical protein
MTSMSSLPWSLTRSLGTPSAYYSVIDDTKSRSDARLSEDQP